MSIDARTIDTAEVAKLVRKSLKRALPGVRFSVRIDRYAGGSTVDVTWTDGPTPEQVQAVTAGYAGGRFNGMTDCPYHADSWYCAEHGPRAAETYGCDDGDRNGPCLSRCCAAAELVHFSADFVHAQRTMSREFRAELAATIITQAGMPAGSTCETILPAGAEFQWHGWDTVADAVYRLGYKTAREVG